MSWANYIEIASNFLHSHWKRLMFFFFLIWKFYIQTRTLNNFFGKAGSQAGDRHLYRIRKQVYEQQKLVYGLLILKFKKKKKETGFFVYFKKFVPANLRIEPLSLFPLSQFQFSFFCFRSLYGAVSTCSTVAHTNSTSPILRSLLFQHGMDEVKRKHSVFVPHFSWHFLQQQILR